MTDEQGQAFRTLIATMQRLLKCDHPVLLVNDGLQACTECGATREGRRGRFKLPLRLEAVRIGLERLAALFATALVLFACGGTCGAPASSDASIDASSSADGAADSAASCGVSNAIPSRDGECTVDVVHVHAYSCNIGGCIDESARGLWCCR